MSTTLTSRPPMGWNSWDCFGTTVTEEEVLANARFMAEHLAPFGWDTVVIDIDWYDPNWNHRISSSWKPGSVTSPLWNPPMSVVNHGMPATPRWMPAVIW